MWRNRRTGPWEHFPHWCTDAPCLSAGCFLGKFSPKTCPPQVHLGAGTPILYTWCRCLKVATRRPVGPGQVVSGTLRVCRLYLSSVLAFSKRFSKSSQTLSTSQKCHLPLSKIPRHGWVRQVLVFMGLRIMPCTPPFGKSCTSIPTLSQGPPMHTPRHDTLQIAYLSWT